MNLKIIHYPDGRFGVILPQPPRAKTLKCSQQRQRARYADDLTSPPIFLRFFNFSLSHPPAPLQGTLSPNFARKSDRKILNTFRPSSRMLTWVLKTTALLLAFILQATLFHSRPPCDCNSLSLPKKVPKTLKVVPLLLRNLLNPNAEKNTQRHVLDTRSPRPSLARPWLYRLWQQRGLLRKLDNISGPEQSLDANVTGLSTAATKKTKTQDKRKQTRRQGKTNKKTRY